MPVTVVVEVSVVAVVRESEGECWDGRVDKGPRRGRAGQEDWQSQSCRRGEFCKGVKLAWVGYVRTS